MTVNTNYRGKNNLFFYSIDQLLTALQTDKKKGHKSSGGNNRMDRWESNFLERVCRRDEKKRAKQQKG